MNKTLSILLNVSIAFLFGCGIMLVLFSSLYFNSWWGFLTIFVNILSVCIPWVFGECGSNSDMDMSFYGDTGDSLTAGMLSWAMMGFFIVIGYFVPIEMYRANILKEASVFITMAGGTLLLISIVVFFRVLYFKKDAFNAYIV